MNVVGGQCLDAARAVMKLMEDAPEQGRGMAGAMPPIYEEGEEEVSEQSSSERRQLVTGQIERILAEVGYPHVVNTVEHQQLHDVEAGSAYVPIGAGLEWMCGEQMLERDQDSAKGEQSGDRDTRH